MLLQFEHHCVFTYTYLHTCDVLGYVEKSVFSTAPAAAAAVVVVAATAVVSIVCLLSILLYLGNTG
jgi:hypothetical protein